MESNLIAFLLGVIVAVVSFILKEIITTITQAIRFRRRLVEDIKITVEGYRNHFTQLQRIKEQIPMNSASFIWDSALGGMSNFSEYGHHLRPLESSQCSRFYDELSRVIEIRMEYNHSVRKIVIEEQNRDAYSDLAISCLEDMEKHYQQIIKRGCQCLLELKKNHWFLEIDEAHCKEELNKG